MTDMEKTDSMAPPYVLVTVGKEGIKTGVGDRGHIACRLLWLFLSRVAYFALVHNSKRGGGTRIHCYEPRRIWFTNGMLGLACVDDGVS